MAIIIGYIGALIMGVTLGLLGGGGSILTVPILVYLFHVDPIAATSYSLFIVGITSLLGSINHAKHGNMDWTTFGLFGVPSIVGVYFSRTWLMPRIPDELFTFGAYTLQKPVFLLVLFAVVMVIAALAMLRRPSGKVQGRIEGNKYRFGMITTEGLGAGVLTGLIGAGGGFIVIPMLIHFGGLSMKKAIGTSLAIIGVKSLIGFGGSLKVGQAIDWQFLILFTIIAIIGIIGGSRLSQKVSNEKLKPAFGWFVLIMGVLMLGKELL